MKAGTAPQGAAPTCEIQWIDAHGRTTPDDNAAVAIARCTQVDPSGVRVRDFAICADHAKRCPKLASVFFDALGRRHEGWWTLLSLGDAS